MQYLYWCVGCNTNMDKQDFISKWTRIGKQHFRADEALEENSTLVQQRMISSFWPARHLNFKTLISTI